MQNVNDILAQAQQLQREGKLSLALQQFQQVLLQHPKELSLHIACGNLCVELQRFEEAAGYFRRILNANKQSSDAINALCYALQGLGNQAHSRGNFSLAEACFEEILQYQANNAIYWYNLGNAQRELGKVKSALASFMQSIQLDPTDADAHNNLGNIQRELVQIDKAIASYAQALQLNPHLHHALAHLVHQKQHMCDWAGLDEQVKQLRDWVMHEPTAQISPFAFIGMPGTTALEQKQCASNWANNLYKDMSATRMAMNLDIGGLQSSAKKLKIGYLSADFRLHPLAFLISELIEKHDRTQFEIVAYSYGADDKTPERKRLQKAFDDFVDIRGLNDQEAAKKIHDDGVHILVDLTGYTQTSRTGIVALKPAANHINWLGFAGSMGELNGKPLFDYIIADKTIAPNQADFSEKVLYLPCYQPNDSSRPIFKASGKPSTKASQHLPEESFVFCCFNQTFKITPDVFAVWMRLLKLAPNSVLWLLECNPWAKENLQGEAALAGVDVKRLIFAPRVPIVEHLARHVLADLFLDTLPYNAHTTASDALWMGLPVLTCMGNTFASRVAASLLNSVQLPELITNSLQEYELKALDFAQNPTKILQIKQKLDAETSKSKLFDTAQFAKDIEQQYLNICLSFIK
jgi:protein O-GlcNAc transferase